MGENVQNDWTRCVIWVSGWYFIMTDFSQMDCRVTDLNCFLAILGNRFIFKRLRRFEVARRFWIKRKPLKCNWKVLKPVSASATWSVLLIQTQLFLPFKQQKQTNVIFPQQDAWIFVSWHIYLCFLMTGRSYRKLITVLFLTPRGLEQSLRMVYVKSFAVNVKKIVPKVLQPGSESSRDKLYLLNIFVSVLCTFNTLSKWSVTCKSWY